MQEPSDQSTRSILSLSQLPPLTSFNDGLIELQISLLLSRAHLLAYWYHQGADPGQLFGLPIDLVDKAQAICEDASNSTYWHARCHYVRGFIYDIAGYYPETVHCFLEAVYFDDSYKKLKRVEWCIENGGIAHGRFQSPGRRATVQGDDISTSASQVRLESSSGSSSQLSEGQVTGGQPHTSAGDFMNSERAGSDTESTLPSTRPRAQLIEWLSDMKKTPIPSPASSSHDSQRIDVDALIKNLSEKGPKGKSNAAIRAQIEARDAMSRQDDSTLLPFRRLREIHDARPSSVINTALAYPTSSTIRSLRSRRFSSGQGHQRPAEPTPHESPTSIPIMSQEEVRQSDGPAVSKLGHLAQQHERITSHNQEYPVYEGVAPPLRVVTSDHGTKLVDMSPGSPTAPSPLRKSSFPDDTDPLRTTGE